MDFDKSRSFVTYNLGNNQVLAMVLEKFDNGDVKTDMDGVRTKSEITYFGPLKLHSVYNVLIENNSFGAAVEHLRNQFDTSKKTARHAVSKAVTLFE